SSSRVIDSQSFVYFSFLLEALEQRNGILHRQLGARADGKMRRRLGVAHEHGVVEYPGLVDDVREVAPQRAVGDQRVAVELGGEDALEHWQHLGLAHRVEAEVAPGRL